jgi:hypothetical protein
LRIKATGINPEPNARQAIEAPLDDLLKLVDRPTVGGCLDPAGELCGLGVICVAVAVGQIRGFLGQPVNPALPQERDKRAEHDEVDRPAANTSTSDSNPSLMMVSVTMAVIPASANAAATRHALRMRSAYWTPASPVSRPVPGSLSLGTAHRQPDTISRCISSPSTCAASGSRCARRRAVVVFPAQALPQMIQISAPLAGWPDGSEVIGQVWWSQAEHAGVAGPRELIHSV